MPARHSRDDWRTESAPDCRGAAVAIPVQSLRNGRLECVVSPCKTWACASCRERNIAALLKAVERQAGDIVYVCSGPIDPRRRQRISTQARRLDAGLLRVVVDDAEECFLTSVQLGGRTEAMTAVPRADALAKLEAFIRSARHVRSRFSAGWTRDGGEESTGEWTALLPAMSPRILLAALSLLPELAVQRFGPKADVRLGSAPIGVAPHHVLSLLVEAVERVKADDHRGADQ